MTEDEIKEFKEKILSELRNLNLGSLNNDPKFKILKMTEYIRNNINRNNNIRNKAEINFCNKDKGNSSINNSIHDSNDNSFSLNKENNNITIDDKQTSRKKLENKIHDLIDQDYQDKEINGLFKGLVTCLTEKGIAVTTPSYNQLKDDLRKYGKDREEQKEILSVAIAYGMPKLKPLHKNDKKRQASNYDLIYLQNSTAVVEPMNIVDLPEDAFELARDENGNLLKF